MQFEVAHSGGIEVVQHSVGTEAVPMRSVVDTPVVGAVDTLAGVAGTLDACCRLVGPQRER